MKRFAKYHFEGQLHNEEILLIIRRHWFDILMQYFVVFLMIFVIVASFSIPSVLIETNQNKNFQQLIIFTQSIFAIIIWLYAFLIWIDYYFDVWIITNERVIDIEQKGLFVRHISELKVSKIQDVTTEVEGLIPSILNYGEVHIQTAGTVTRFLFHNVPNPYEIKGMLMNLQKKAQRKETKKLSEAIHRATTKTEDNSPFLK